MCGMGVGAGVLKTHTTRQVRLKKDMERKKQETLTANSSSEYRDEVKGFALGP